MPKILSLAKKQILILKLKFMSKILFCFRKFSLIILKLNLFYLQKSNRLCNWSTILKFITKTAKENAKATTEKQKSFLPKLLTRNLANRGEKLFLLGQDILTFRVKLKRKRQKDTNIERERYLARRWERVRWRKFGAWQTERIVWRYKN